MASLFRSGAGPGMLVGVRAFAGDLGAVDFFESGRSRPGRGRPGSGALARLPRQERLGHRLGRPPGHDLQQHRRFALEGCRAGQRQQLAGGLGQLRGDDHGAGRDRPARVGRVVLRSDRRPAALAASGGGRSGPDARQERPCLGQRGHRWQTDLRLFRRRRAVLPRFRRRKALARRVGRSGSHVGHCRKSDPLRQDGHPIVRCRGRLVRGRFRPGDRARGLAHAPLQFGVLEHARAGRGRRRGRVANGTDRQRRGDQRRRSVARRGLRSRRRSGTVARGRHDPIGHAVAAGRRRAGL